MKKAIEVIGQELRWHTENKGITNRGEVYEDGFIAGITHIHSALLRIHASQPTNQADHQSRCACAPDQGGPCSFCMEAKYNL